MDDYFEVHAAITHEINERLNMYIFEVISNDFQNRVQYRLSRDLLEKALVFYQRVFPEKFNDNLPKTNLDHAVKDLTCYKTYDFPPSISAVSVALDCITTMRTLITTEDTPTILDIIKKFKEDYA